MIYLDNAATTYPKPEIVYSQMDIVNRELAVNSGRGSYRLAQKASKMISDTKNQIRNLIKADISSSVVFSPSITIAINQVLNGINLNSGDVVYISPYEHNAVARCLNYIKQVKGIIIKEIPIDESTLEIDINKLIFEFVKHKPSLVVCTHISNVTGYILPVKNIFEEAKKYNCITVLDSAQSLGLIDVDSRILCADIICFAGHKSLYGPFGIGGFVNISNVPLNVFITGGTGSDSLNLDMPINNETRFEPSSSNIIAVAGLSAALSIINPKELQIKEKELTNYLICRLKELHIIDKLYLYSNDNQIGIVSFTVKDYLSEDIGNILDEDFDIAVRTGYHCVPFIHKYLKDESSLGTIRVGLGQFSTKNDIDILIESLSSLEDD